MEPIHKLGGTLCHVCRTIISKQHVHNLFCDKCLETKELCDCGKVAVWCYMPSSSLIKNPHYCDDCVPRGCSCNHHSLKEEYNNQPEGKEGIDYKWIDDETWVPLDEEGKEFPCCEYWDDYNGWEI